MFYKTWPKVIEIGESEVDFNQLIILRMLVWIGDRLIKHPYLPYIHNLLMMRKQLLYEKELSESTDERYLFLYLEKIMFVLVVMIILFNK
jgi:hypothetical protein